MIWLAVGVGGAVGSMARHGVNILVGRVLDRAVPYATAVANLAGSLVIGVLAGLIAMGRLRMSNETRAFVFVGILGGFTTFSSLMLDTLSLTKSGQPGLGFGTLALQTVFGLALVWAGYAMARSL